MSLPKALLKLFRECGGFRIRIRRTGDAGVVTADHRAAGDLGHLGRIQTVRVP